MRAALLAFALLAVSSPAAAAGDLPTAVFAGQPAADVINLIMKGCIDRGFIIRAKTPSSVVCQASDIPNKKDGGFKPRQAGPDKPFMTFTFTATEQDGGVRVVESTSMVLLINGESPTSMDGFGGFRFKAQVRDFLTELGGVVAP